MRQILYVSKSTALLGQSALDAILLRSRHNNALDGVTGLLWSDGERFVQVIEGDERAVGDAMDRIRADDRHQDIAVLRDRQIVERQFGDWTMALRRSGAAADQYDERIRRALAEASEADRTVFASLVEPVSA